MSKASEWLKMALARPPDLIGHERVNGTGAPLTDYTIARVDNNGRCRIELSNLRTADALALAAWIVDTFGDSAHKPEGGEGSDGR